MTKSKSKSKKSEKGKESNNSTNASDNRVSNYKHFNEKDSEIGFLRAAILEVISHSKWMYMMVVFLLAVRLLTFRDIENKLCDLITHRKD